MFALFAAPAPYSHSHSRPLLLSPPLSLRPLLPLLTGMDRLMFRSQRVSDTWMLAVARRP